MKKIFILLFLANVGTCAFADNVAITWPVNYSVFQRNTTTTGGSANVTFAGQFWNGSGAQYRIEKLTATGGSLGDWKTYQGLPSGSESILGTSASTYFYFVLSVPTGWYRFYIKDGAGTETSIKFGVGEVFVIAGQSNAQGAGDGAMEIGGIGNDYECVVSSKLFYGSNLDTFQNLEFPVFGPLNSTNPTIGPRGDRPWYYKSLGRSIASKEPGIVIPVCFFNVSQGGSSIDMWYNSLQRTRTGMFGGNYYNTMVPGTTTTHQNPWGPASDDRFPYIDLKNVISLYCNMLGVRAVIWHQGEAETNTLLNAHLSGTYGSGPIPAGYSIGNYDTKLNAIIADTRSILPNLPWAISKVSLMSKNRLSTAGGNFDINIVNNIGNNLVVPGFTTVAVGGTVTQEQANVLSTSNVSWASQNSDSYNAPTKRQPDGTHFNSDGLTSLAADVFSNISSILAKSPILPAEVPRLSLTQLSTYKHTLSTSTFYSHYWRVSPSPIRYDQTVANMGNPYTSSASVDAKYSGYTKTTAGRIYIVQPNVVVAFIPGARIGVDETTATGSNAFPNPVVNTEEFHVSFKLAKPSPVTLQLLKSNGQLLEQIKDELPAGVHQYKFPVKKIRGTDDLSFIIYHLKTNEHNESRKILLVK